VMMGERLDGYVEAELLGGGMSRVYRATRRRDGRVVAVKSVVLASEDLARAERRGAELQQQFHAVEPRVPDVCDIRTEGDLLLIEMEYIAGEDLSTVIRTRGRLTATDAVRLAAGLADVLDGAHQFTATVDGETYRGIIHGDLKPRNVRLASGDDRCDRRLKVLDFGVAKGIRGGSDGHTRNVFGSAPYMAPERLIDGAVSPATDCWSLGVVLCEMLTGAVPYSGSERDVLLQIERGAPALPSDCPGDLALIVERLLARDPKARYASAGAIRDELNRWLNATRRTEPVPAGPASIGPGPIGSAPIGSALAGAAVAQPWTPAPGLPPLLPPFDATRRTTGSHVAGPDATRRTTAPQLSTSEPTKPIGVASSGWKPPIPAIPEVPAAAAAAAAAPETATVPAAPASGWEPVQVPPIPSVATGVSSPATSPVDGAVSPASAVPAPGQPVRRKRRSRVPFVVAAGFVLWVFWNVGREVRVWNESGLLGRRVLAAEPSALEDMWRTFGSLTEQSSFGIGTLPARGPMRLALVQHVDRVLDDFRRPEPTVRESQWKQARVWAAAALELGNDPEIRARFLICDAHLKRIAGDAALRRGQLDQSRRLLNDAISQFEQAANLARRSPDPWLGLLRLYAGTRRDPDQAQIALNEAVRREYAAGPREYALLGDAARDRGEDVERGCGDLKDTDLEKKCLASAKEQFEHAVDWYQKALGYGSASRGAATAERGIRRVEARVDDLDQVPWFLRLLKRSQKPSETPPATPSPSSSSVNPPQPSSQW
jgi:serine/threonine protein kinase